MVDRRFASARDDCLGAFQRAPFFVFYEDVQTRSGVVISPRVSILRP
jgi:hypothetical protein